MSTDDALRRSDSDEGGAAPRFPSRVERARAEREQAARAVAGSEPAEPERVARPNPFAAPDAPAEPPAATGAPAEPPADAHVPATVTPSDVAAGTRATSELGDRRLSGVGILHGEWIKALGLRSTWWTLGLTIGVMVAFAGLISFPLAAVEAQGELQDLNPLFVAISAGMGFAQLAVAVLGALIITGEFTTGSVRSTFAAAPRRTGVVLAKAAVLSLLVGVAGALATAASLGVALAAFSGTGHGFDASDATSWRILTGTVLYLVTLALFSMGIGAILRNSTASIFSLVAILFVLPAVAQIAGAFEATRWIATAGRYLPATAGNQLLMETTAHDALTPWQGYAVFAAWTVAALVVGWVLTKKRDA